MCRVIPSLFLKNRIYLGENKYAVPAHTAARAGIPSIDLSAQGLAWHWEPVLLFLLLHEFHLSALVQYIGIVIIYYFICLGFFKIVGYHCVETKIGKVFFD